MKKVFVCAGSDLPKNQKIIKQAQILGKILAQSNCIYAQGGSANGLMGASLQEFIKYKKKDLEFFIPEKYFEYDTKDLIALLGDNKGMYQKMRSESQRLEAIKQCDKIIVLPGGTGTIEEVLFCNETARSNEHQNEIILVNIDGFFDNLIKQIQTCIDFGFSNQNAIKLKIVNNVEEINLKV